MSRRFNALLCTLFAGLTPLAASAAKDEAPPASPATSTTRAPKATKPGANAVVELPAATSHKEVLPPAPAETPAPLTKLVAIMELKHDDEAAPLANGLMAALTSEVAAREGMSAVSRNELAALLNQRAEAALLGCDTVNCAADIGKLVDAELVILGGLERVPGEETESGASAYLLSLSLVEAKGPSVVGRVDLVWRSPAEAMVTVVGPTVDRLFGGAEADRFTGALEVFAAPGTAVAVDGVAHGVTPLGAPIGGLAIGVHIVQLSRDGYVTRRPDVVIARNETTLLRLELEPEPLHRQWWFWATLGGVAVTAITGGTAVAWWLMPRDPPKTEVVLGVTAAAP